MSKYINTNALIRIIDAQMSNIECLKKIQDKEILEGKKRHCTIHYSIKLETLNNVLETIDSMLGADVTPVIHAKWSTRTEKCNDIVCSHCGMLSIWEFSYCPGCGARMDEEENAESE